MLTQTLTFTDIFQNVENGIEQVLKDTYNEALEDIETFDEMSNLCEGSEQKIVRQLLSCLIEKYSGFRVI